MVHADETAMHLEAAREQVKKGDAAAAVEPLSKADASLAVTSADIADASKRYAGDKSDCISLAKERDKLNKKLGDLKAEELRKIRLMLVSIGGFCFVAALGFGAAGFWLGMRGGFQVAGVCGAAACVSWFAAVYLKTILVVTGCVLLAAAVGFGAWHLYHHDPARKRARQ